MSYFGPLPDEQEGIGRGSFGPLGDSTNGGSQDPGWRFNAPFAYSGRVYEELVYTDLHFVADDANPISWASRTGSRVALANGTPIIGLETPQYPNGGYNGTGFRTAMQNGADGNDYVIPYDVSDEITITSQLTWIIRAITGDFSTNEIYISRYAGSYSFYVAALTIFGPTPYIEVRIGHTISDAVVQFQPSRNTLYDFKITYDGPSRTVSLAVNGYDIASAVGMGDPSSFGTDDIHIGSADGLFSVTTSKIIEIQRSQTILATSPDWRNMFNKSCGIIDLHDIQPLQFVRNSKSAMYVNNKMWQFGENWPRLREYGYLQENTITNVLQNSTFTESFGTGWLGSSGNVSYITHIDQNSNVGGVAFNMLNDITGTTNDVFWDYGFLGAGITSRIYFEWEAVTLSTNIYFTIFNSVTGNYYDTGTQTWVPTPPVTPIDTSSGGKRTVDFFFVNDVVGGPVVIVPYNGFETNTNELVIFHVQFSPGYDVVASPFVFDGVAGGSTCTNDILQFPSSVINYNDGKLMVDITPEQSSLEATSIHDLSHLGGTTEFLFRPTGGSGFYLSDGINTASIFPAYSRNQTMNVEAVWGTPGAILNISESTSGLSNTAIFLAPLNSGNLAVGSDTTTTSFQSYAYIKNLKIK